MPGFPSPTDEKPKVGCPRLRGASSLSDALSITITVKREPPSRDHDADRFRIWLRASEQKSDLHALHIGADILQCV
jgi:hypothetical protein